MGLHDQHRQRIDARIREYGLESLAPHEQLEYLLFAVIPRGDTNAIAHELLERFITIEGVFMAEVEELEQVTGVGHRTAMFLSTMPQLLGVVERNISEDKKPVLDRKEVIEDFVKTYFYTKLDEAFYVLSLGSKRKLIAVSKISDGDEGETPAYVKKVVKRAVMNNAKAAILVHNHPCGNVMPSVSDVSISNEFKRVLETIGIEFVDSLIVSGKQCCSLKDGGYLNRMYRKY